MHAHFEHQIPGIVRVVLLCPKLGHIVSSSSQFGLRTCLPEHGPGKSQEILFFFFFVEPAVRPIAAGSVQI